MLSNAPRTVKTTGRNRRNVDRFPAIVYPAPSMPQDITTAIRRNTDLGNGNYLIEFDAPEMIYICETVARVGIKA